MYIILFKYKSLDSNGLMAEEYEKYLQRYTFDSSDVEIVKNNYCNLWTYPSQSMWWIFHIKEVVLNESIYLHH